MPKIDPQVIIRLGSHAEKEYIEKTIKYFDGLMVGANLIEVSPGATASLLFRLTGQTHKPYYIDPMTYAFGAYIDPVSGRVRDDLDWIKSEQKVKGKKGQTKRDFKSSYKKLAEEFGAPFTTALQNSRAVGAADFPDDKTVEEVCRRILDYQEKKVRSIFEEDEETAGLAKDIPLPGAIFAPYFYIEMSQCDTWIELNRRFALSTAVQGHNCPVHLVICCHRDLLTNRTQAGKVIDYVKSSRCDGAWLWFSRFDEHIASSEELEALRWWVEEITSSKTVFNMHGGYFSLALSSFGLSGIAHGVGYGEQKDVVPIIGQSTPTVQYYVRPLHAKYSIVQITRCFTDLKIATPKDFFEKICDCAICKGIIADNLANFAQFGEIRYSSPSSKRAAQTPDAAKRCRFHFLLNRIKEREFVRKASITEITVDMENIRTEWAKTFLARNGNIDHLIEWKNALV